MWPIIIAKTRATRQSNGRSAMSSRLSAVMLAMILASFSGFAAEPEDGVRRAFTAFVDAQNARDLKAVKVALLDAPTVLWVIQGTSVWGRPDVLAKFEYVFQGFWKFEPSGAPRVWSLGPDVAALQALVKLTWGSTRNAPNESLLLFNVVFVRKDGAWRVASMIPVAAASPLAGG
jgi:ketosteroid isomerase-like protein